jgi:hypothetical protein
VRRARPWVRGARLFTLVGERLVERRPARGRRQLDSEAALDRVEPRRLRLQQSLKVVEALDELAQNLSLGLVFGHKALPAGQ